MFYSFAVKGILGHLGARGPEGAEVRWGVFFGRARGPEGAEGRCWVFFWMSAVFFEDFTYLLKKNMFYFRYLGPGGGIGGREIPPQGVGKICP